MGHITKVSVSKGGHRHVYSAQCLPGTQRSYINGGISITFYSFSTITVLVPEPSQELTGLLSTQLEPEASMHFAVLPRKKVAGTESEGRNLRLKSPVEFLPVEGAGLKGN